MGEPAVETYLDLLLEAPRRIVLMAPREREKLFIKHVKEAEIYLPYIKAGDRVLDVGTGAGFPGIPLALARRDVSFTLADRKKINVEFLAGVVEKLSLDNVSLLNVRAEDLARSGFRPFDVAVARAVSRARTLLAWASPVLRTGGLFLMGKGRGAEEEMEAAEDLPFTLKEKRECVFGWLLVFQRGPRSE